MAVISCLETLFGSKIYDYMILFSLVGDELEADEKSLEVFVRDSLDTLKEVLRLCGNRRVLFANGTKDEAKIAKQVQELISYVNTVLEKNFYLPFTNAMFAEMKPEGTALMDQEKKAEES
ncbi:immune-associated nucleotide-binding protein 9-like [Rutidosis leptorrhynchoides]|uniref:immune-associated nucleotide-binding protein 9-like n=1 Tax=Rutidosis leptorrhynchoides TaxID=125765 RepID=UPI003A9A5FC0